MAKSNRRPKRSRPRGRAPAASQLGEALRALEADDPHKALPILQGVVSSFPQNADALHLYGVALHRTGSLSAALNALQSACKLTSSIEPHMHLGLALREAGRFKAAAAAFRHCVTLRPDLLEAQGNLATALLACDEFEEARELFATILRSQPTVIQARLGLAEAEFGLGEADRAFETLARLLPLSGEQAPFAASIGSLLVRLQRYDDAVAPLETAIAANAGDGPGGDVALALLLGESHLRAGRLVEAREVLEHTEPSAGSASVAKLTMLGEVLGLQGEFAEASACLKRAVELSPTDANPQFRLGEMLVSIGDFNAAREHLSEAVRLDPGFGLAYEALVGITRFDDSNAMVLGDIERQLSRSDLSVVNRTAMYFAAGKAADDLGRHEAAFDHFRAGNQLVWQREPWNSDEHSQQVEQIIAQTGQAALERIRDLQSGEAPIGEGRPVFVIGMPRSGTTLLEATLARHHAVDAGGEVVFFDALRIDGCGYPALMHCIDPARAKALRARYLEALWQAARHRPGAVVATDKMPTNFLFLGMLAGLFPEARFIHLERDAIDTCWSIYCQNFTFATANAYAFDLYALGRFYSDYERLMAHWRQQLDAMGCSERVLTVDYEALVSDHERVGRLLFEHVGLAVGECTQEAAHAGAPDLASERQRGVYTASSFQVRQSVNTRSIGRSAPYRRWLGDLFKGLGREG